MGKNIYSNYIENINFMFLLWDNQIGDEGCTALSKCLSHLTNLTELYLSSKSKCFESTLKLVYILNIKITVLDEFVLFFSFWMWKQKSLFFYGKKIFIQIM